MRATDPTGQTWRVTRRWVPWRRRLKGMMGFPDLSIGAGGDPISLVIGVVALIIAIPFILLTVVAGLELLLVLLVLPFAVLGRVLLGRHWHVEVRRGFRPWHEVEAGDWQASGLLVRELATAVERGEVPERTLDVPAAD